MKVADELARRVFPHRLHIKALPRRAAEVYLDQHLPDLEGDDREYALSFAGQHIPEPKKPQPQDALFCAAMYQRGVSLGDLAKFFGIKKPTVHQKIGRKLNEAERQLRDRLDALDPEVLSLCYELFNKALAVAPGCYDGQYPIDIGRGLMSASMALVAEDRGEEPAPSRPRRYSNRNTLTKEGKELAAEVVEAAKQRENAEESIGILAHGEELLEKHQLPQPNVVRPEEQSFLDSLTEE